MNRQAVTGIFILLLLGLGLWYVLSLRSESEVPASKDDLIIVHTPLPNAAVKSPLTISGRARGNWYFEASFPVRLLDGNGNQLAIKPAQAMDNWMTTEYVPFDVTLTFTTPTTDTGILVLEKDNPSGLPEHANELRIPVRFVQDRSFSEDGVVTRNNPGQKPDVWYLIFEMPGSPALSVELKFGSMAAPSLFQGDRVHVEGSREGSVISVTSITTATEETGMNVKLHFYNPELDQGPGGEQCSRNGLVAVKRVIPKTTTPLRDVIQLLLRGELSDEERANGVTTEYPLPGLSLKSATITNGIATLTFIDPQNKTVGGSCRVSILWHQIEATARQFPSVTSVRFIPEQLFQP